MTDPNAFLSPIRPFTSFVGSMLIAVAAAKLAGISIPMRGEYWQIALMGLALKAF